MSSSICEIISERPWLRRLCVAYGLDPRSAAPIPQQVELQTHLRQIWNGPEALRLLTPGQLLDYVMHCHHRYLRRVLPQLVSQAASLDHPVLAELQAVQQESKPHMFREEVEVFPALREAFVENRSASHLHRWIARLEREHGQAFQRFQRMRQLAAQPHPGSESLLAGLEELSEDMRWHMFVENDLLFAQILRTAS